MSDHLKQPSRFYCFEGSIYPADLWVLIMLPVVISIVVICSGYGKSVVELLLCLCDIPLMLPIGE